MEQSKELQRKFAEQGFVVLKQFLGSNELTELRREIQRYRVETLPHVPSSDVYYEVPGDPETLKQLIRMSQYDRYFKDLIESERLEKLAELLLGTRVIGKNMQWFNKPIGVSRATPPHQDGYYFMLEPNQALTMWLALDEVGEDNGCVRYVCGSHSAGLRNHARTSTPGFSQAITDYGTSDREKE